MKQVCVSMAVVPLVWLNLGITQPLQVEVKAEETKEKEVKQEANTGAAKQLSKEEYAKLSAEEGLGNVLEATVTDNVITLKIDNGDEAEDDYLEISPLANNLLKVNLRPRNIENSPSTPMIDPNATFTAIGATIDLESDPMIISTDECTLEIAKEPARMTFKDKNGKRYCLNQRTAGFLMAVLDLSAALLTMFMVPMELVLVTETWAWNEIILLPIVIRLHKRVSKVMQEVRSCGLQQDMAYCR